MQTKLLTMAIVKRRIAYPIFSVVTPHRSSDLRGKVLLLYVTPLQAAIRNWQIWPPAALRQAAMTMVRDAAAFVRRALGPSS
jgi:hypothetical protein